MNKRDEAAISYIKSNGTHWQAWRACRLAGDTIQAPPKDWAPQQHSNGGVLRPYCKSSVPSVGATSGLLLAISFVGFMDTPEARRAIEFAWKSQQEDGRWTEDATPDSVPPPPWFTPEDVTVDLWETANMVASLAALGYADDHRLRKAVDWAEGYAQTDGGFPGYIHTTYGMASVQYRLGNVEKANEHLSNSLTFLDSHPDIHDLNWGLMLFYVGGIPVTHPTVNAYLARVANLQGQDGLWPTVYTGSEVYFTLEALELLTAYGMR